MKKEEMTVVDILFEAVGILEVCVGKVRRYTITMVRFIKLIFILCLLLTSVCDVMGYQMEPAYSLIVVGVILLDTFYFEIKIIRILKEQNKDK